MPKNLRLENLRWGTELVKRGFAKMQKGGVVMDVTNAEQAAIAEEAGAVAVMALERVPADIRAQGGVARMSDPTKILEIIDAVTIPVMAKSRIGHTAESKILQELGVDMIDESEVLTPADPYFHVLKRDFTVPFVCGATQLGEAVRRIAEGAAMIRTKGEAGTGNIVEAVRHRRMVTRGIERVVTLDKAEIRRVAEHYSLRYRPLLEQVYAEQGAALNGSDALWGKWTIAEMTDEVEKVLHEVRKQKRLPVVDFVAGGIATPADAALVMQMGSDGVFVGSGIFKASNPEQRAKAIVEATTHFDDPKILAEVSKNLGEAMRGIPTDDMPQEARLAIRGI